MSSLCAALIDILSLCHPGLDGNMVGQDLLSDGHH